jgi:hypothetical protein
VIKSLKSMVLNFKKCMKWIYDRRLKCAIFKYSFISCFYIQENILLWKFIDFRWNKNHPIIICKSINDNRSKRATTFQVMRWTKAKRDKRTKQSLIAYLLCPDKAGTGGGTRLVIILMPYLWWLLGRTIESARKSRVIALPTLNNRSDIHRNRE